jgi:hypothetical protein
MVTLALLTGVLCLAVWLVSVILGTVAAVARIVPLLPVALRLDVANALTRAWRAALGLLPLLLACALLAAHLAR